MTPLPPLLQRCPKKHSSWYGTLGGKWWWCPWGWHNYCYYDNEWKYYCTGQITEALGLLWPIFSAGRCWPSWTSWASWPSSIQCWPSPTQCWSSSIIIGGPSYSWETFYCWPSSSTIVGLKREGRWGLKKEKKRGRGEKMFSRGGWWWPSLISKILYSIKC